MKRADAGRTKWIIAILYTILIFSFSMMSGESSGGLSAKITNFFMPLFSGLGISFEAAHHLIRKLAHFGEYYILALLVSNAAKSTLPIKKAMPVIILYGLITPCIDETIQFFTDGRAGMIADVFLDMSGYFAAWATLSLLRSRHE